MVNTTGNRDFKPGYCDVRNLVMTNYLGERIDISRLVHSFTVNESINSMFALYEFTIVDAVNLLEKYTVTGNEKIEMTLLKMDLPGTEEVQIEKNLIVVGIGDYTKPNNEGQAYKIQAITETAFAASIKRVSRSGKGTAFELVESLVSDVIYRDELTTEGDTDSGNYSVVYPNYTYIDTIKMLLGRAQEDSGSVYYAYETLFDGMILSSYSQMVAKESVETYRLLSKDEFPKYSEANYEHNRTRIMSIESKIGASQFRAFQEGANTSRVHTVDIYNKSYNFEDYSSLDRNLPTVNKDRLLDSNLLISDKPIDEYPEAKSHLVLKNSGSFAGAGENLNNRLDNSSALRFMVTGNQYAVTHVIKITGDTRVRAGQVIELDIPPAIHPDTAPDDYQDLLMSGRYLVSGVLHEIDASGNYYSKVSLRKDSINKQEIVDKYRYLESR